MTHKLTGATLKLQRANAHFDALNKAVGRARERNTHSYWADFNPEAGLCVMTVEADAPPVTWAPLIGDVLHNVHSALDHLMWELIRRRNHGVAPDPNTRATFPIFANRRKFWAKSKKGKGKRQWTSRAGATSLLEVPGDARHLILEVQPYKNRHRDHPLWHLYALSNADKHQTLHYAHHAVLDGTLKIICLRGAEIQSFEPRPSQIVPGRRHVIGYMRYAITGEDSQIKIKPNFTLTEAFAKDTPAGGYPLIKVVREIMDFVIVEVFTKRFWPYFGADPQAEIRLIREYAKTYAD